MKTQKRYFRSLRQTTQDFYHQDFLQCLAMSQRLLITGAAGFLGSHLIQQATKKFTVAGTLHHTPAAAVPGVSFHICDLQQPDQVNMLLDRVKPEVIIHTACSEQGEGLDAIVPAAGLLARHTAERCIRFIHLSTDQVFDGTRAPYTEDSPTNPINHYGKAKAKAEKIIASLNPQATIVRNSLLYDLLTPDRQTTRLIQVTQTGEPYRLFIDEYRCPMWVENLAEVLLELARKEYAGILHLGGPERLNRWDLGIQLLNHFGVTPTPNIQQGTIKESGLIRPKDLTLNTTRAKRLLQTSILSFHEVCTQLAPSARQCSHEK
jgi:dTDP-4-dehydrorhamnose reductase